MFKFGFEREFFLIGSKSKKPILAPYGCPHDRGILAEARGEPASNVHQAAFNLMCETRRMQKLYPTISTKYDSLEVDKALRIEAARVHEKGLVAYQNLYGHVNHPVSSDTITAGLHISITRPTTQSKYEGKKLVTIEYNRVWDYARFVRLMDEHFAKVIEKAKRAPGFYEIKPDCRIEYRSLPQSVDVLKVADFVASIMPSIQD